MTDADIPIAVLTSGGLDSAILVVELAAKSRSLYPIYVRAGLGWEGVEQQYLCEFLRRTARPSIQPLVVLDMPVGDIYGEHWSLTGRGVPDASTADEAVFLPGRNLLLLLKAMLWCHLHGVPALALAPLKGNPFPDATDSFFEQFGVVVNAAVEGSVAILRPYSGLDKSAVLHRGRGLPLRWTFSCIRPLRDLHCGNCNKCAERKRAFRDAGIEDPTEYASAGG